MHPGWLHRRYMWYLRRKEVLTTIKDRKGACLRCGKCCGHCILLDKKGGRCRIYKYRPDICRYFPLTPQDLKHLPKCGYAFKAKGSRVK